MSFIKPLTELTRTDLPLAGGKGANLGALSAAGLPVPPGFCVTTAGYRAFVDANQLADRIAQTLAAAQLDAEPVAGVARQAGGVIHLGVRG